MERGLKQARGPEGKRKAFRLAPRDEMAFFRRMTRLALACLLATGIPAAASAVPYKGAIVLDCATGRALFEDGADEVSPPASMTKLMTFAVIEDQLRAGAFKLDTPVTVTPADAKVAMLKDSTSVWLKTNEVFTVDEMIYAMMIQSANDAAYAMAAFTAGSVDLFVAKMNAKAAALGMTRTRFRTPNGLPVRSHRIADGDLTTPRDFALLSRYLILHTDILRYTSVKTRPFGFGRRFPPTMMTNHNHLLGKIAGVDGLKTGFTTGAGFCLAATAQRSGRRIIVVMMDCPDSHDRDLAVARLIERGFATSVMPEIKIGETAPTRPAPAGDTPVIKFSVPPR